MKKFVITEDEKKRIQKMYSLINEQPDNNDEFDYGLEDNILNDPNIDNVKSSLDTSRGIFHVEGASTKAAMQLFKNFLHMKKTDVEFIAFRNCEQLDFSNIDFCKYPKLMFVNLMGTPNNFEETQDDCYEKIGDGRYAFNTQY